MIAFFKREEKRFPDLNMTLYQQKLLKGMISGAILCILVVAGFAAQPALAEGSRDMYPNGAQGSRASVEWRNSSYGGQAVLRRTLFRLYANAGEYIMLGSSAVGAPTTPTHTISNADILVYNPDLVTGVIGTENIPATASFSCQAQRAQTGNTTLGRIGTRTQELAGPDVILNAANGTTGGSITRYAPCYYQAPVSGIYNVVFYGPAGNNRNTETPPSGSIADVPENFNASQDTAVSSWDVTVRFRLDAVTPEFHGRLFSRYLALYTGGNARPLFSSIYPISTDGYQYRADLRGLDPDGFLLYANQVGFYDNDGATPLYHDVLAAPNAFNQNQLSSLQGGVTLAPPLYPIFFNLPDPAALSALRIPLTPAVPMVDGLTFTGAVGGSTYPGAGGTFRYTSNISGVYQLIISRDGVNFDPTNLLNRTLGGIRGLGPQAINWDGRDNSGNPFPVGGPYKVRFKLNAGEVHFPLIDAENSPLGGPTYTLLNSPVPGCTNQAFGCTTVFYDDEGYRTLSGQIVGQLGAKLCGQNPPPVSYPMNGADSSSSARAYGAASGGNAGVTCTAGGNGAFGDTKALDLWTFFPSNFITTVVIIINQPTPAPTATPTPTSPPIIGGGGTPTPTSGPSTTASPGPSPTPTGGTPGSSPSAPPENGTPGAGDGSGGTGGGSGGSGNGTPGTGGGNTGSGTKLPGLPNTGHTSEIMADSNSWLLLLGSAGLGLLFIGAGFFLLSDRKAPKARSRK